MAREQGSFSGNTPQHQWDQAADLYRQRQGEKGDPEKQFYYSNILVLLESIGGVKNKKVFDAGCGSGDWTRTLGSMGAAYVEGIDSSKRQIALANSKINPPNVHFSEADLRQRLQFARNSFHIIVSNFVLSYIENSKLPTTIDEFYRVLRPGGSGIIGIQNQTYQVAHHHQNMLGLGSGNFTQTVGFWDNEPARKLVMDIGEFDIYYRTNEQYIDLLEDAGLKFKKIVEPKPPEELIKEHPKYAYLPPFAIYLFEKPIARSFSLLNEMQTNVQPMIVRRDQFKTIHHFVNLLSGKIEERESNYSEADVEPITSEQREALRQHLPSIIRTIKRAKPNDFKSFYDLGKEAQEKGEFWSSKWSEEEIGVLHLRRVDPITNNDTGERNYHSVKSPHIFIFPPQQMGEAIITKFVGSINITNEKTVISLSDLQQPLVLWLKKGEELQIKALPFTPVRYGSIVPLETI